MLTLSSKLPQVGTTIFSVMSALANEVNAVNLSQGFPDFEANTQMIELVNQAMKKGLNQYAPMIGVQVLREAIAQKTEFLYQAKCNPDTEITVVSGASEAIFDALACLINQGDEVIILEPAYDLYLPTITLFGGKVVPISLDENYQIPFDLLKNAINSKTKALIINTPHNPTGIILKANDLKKLEDLLENTNIVLISDEVYEHIVFDGQTHESVMKYPKLRQRSFVVSSFGKTYHTTGWKLGYCIAPDFLTKELRKIHQFNTFSTNTPMQYAMAEFLNAKENYLDLPNFYQERRDKFKKMLSETPFKILPCEGTYFQLASYEHLSQEKDTDYTIRLTKELKVATIPISVFYHNQIDRKVIRFCFAKKYETLEKGIENLIKGKDKLYQK
ncbi:MAG: aminotransferase class I/II-fold pyridoxal phosphate-dependent enzyme [Bacteroidetes bacterium]|nr:MAG: aminotransferase class I/II-fold pyridoxal phosphate-dependent enzyme [Bacteroidota bacterium]TAG89212.1 MAG: aminotransferase class I/II-fold pyridoxal phosphate-dependent enzyme [Bacteroidota bacterium]